MDGEAQAILQRPAQPGGGQREGTGMGDDAHLAGADPAGQRGADAEPHGIARGQHHDIAASQRIDQLAGAGEGRRPFVLFGGGRHQRQMAGAAHHHLGGFH